MAAMEKEETGGLLKGKACTPAPGDLRWNQQNNGYKEKKISRYNLLGLP